MQTRRSFLLGAIGLSAATLTLPGAARLALASEHSAFGAGAGRADVNFSPSLFPLDGFTECTIRCPFACSCWMTDVRGLAWSSLT